MKNILFIYNPTSGEAEIGAHLDQIIALYQKNDYMVVPLRISREIGFDPVPEMIRQLSPEYILLAGGDGTVNRFVNFMQANGIDLPIAIIPAGTANDFAKMAGMRENIMSSVKKILAGKIENFDLGMAGDQYFVNIFSTGLFTDVSKKTPTAMKNTFGKVAYYFGSIGELPNFRYLDVNIISPGFSYNGKCLMLLIFNGHMAGNIPLANASSAKDGLLDVIIIKGENISKTIRAVFHLITQQKGKYPSDVVYFQTSSVKVEIDSNPPSDIDGEPGGNFPMEIRCIPQALKVIVP